MSAICASSRTGSRARRKSDGGLVVGDAGDVARLAGRARAGMTVPVIQALVSLRRLPTVAPVIWAVKSPIQGPARLRC